MTVRTTAGEGEVVGQGEGDVRENKEKDGGQHKTFLLM